MQHKFLRIEPCLFAVSPSMEHYGQPSHQNTQHGPAPQPGSPTDNDGVDAAQQPRQSSYAYSIGAQYPMTYTTDPQAVSDVHREQSTGHYSQYGSNLMYNIGGQSSPVTQFGMPSPSQYYNPALSSPQILSMSTQGVSVPFSPQYASPATAQPYGLDPSQTTAYGLYAQQQQHYGQAQAQQPQPQQQMQSTEQALEGIQNQFRQIFTLVRDNEVQDAGVRLLETSKYLLGNVETFDDPVQHDARIRLWDGFNQAWLVMLQRQLDLTQEHQAGRSSANIMDVETLSGMSSELVRLCDSVEKHGLVDYQMGVAEDEIVDMILRCIAALRPGGENASSRAGRSSTADSSRRRGR